MTDLGLRRRGDYKQALVDGVYVEHDADQLDEFEPQKHPALFTVADAVREYLEWNKANTKGYERTRTVCEGIIVPALGTTGCGCPWDLNGDSQVSGADIGLLLLQWSLPSDNADFDGDGQVGGEDLGVLLVNWGACG